MLQARTLVTRMGTASRTHAATGKLLPEIEVARGLICHGRTGKRPPGFTDSRSRSTPPTTASVRTDVIHRQPGQTSARLRLPWSSPITWPSHRRHVEQPGAGRTTASTVWIILVTVGYAGEARGLCTRHDRLKGGRARNSTPPVEEQVALPRGTIPSLVNPAMQAVVRARLDRPRTEATRNHANPEAALWRPPRARTRSVRSSGHCTR